MIISHALPLLRILFLLALFVKFKFTPANASLVPTMAPVMSPKMAPTMAPTTAPTLTLRPTYVAGTGGPTSDVSSSEGNSTLDQVEEHWLLNGTLEEGVLLLGDFENETVTALKAMYDSFEMNATGLDWLNENIPVCEWQGIGCNETEHIKVIALDSSSLRGTIPEEISLLRTLEVLSLATNYIQGSIPESIGLLTELTSVGMSWNNISGPIPTTIGNLKNLATLDFWENALSGPIPTEIGQLGNLTYLDFEGNSINGSIPSELGGASSLSNLYLTSNEMSGKIPTTLKNLSRLMVAVMSFNEFSGTIPSEIGELTKLMACDLSYNELTGTIPSTIGMLREVQEFYVDDNKLNGTIPTEIGMMSALQLFSAATNELTGSLPSELGNMESIYGVSIENNKIGGFLPSELANWTNEKILLYDFDIECCDASAEKNQSLCGICCQCLNRRYLHTFFWELNGNNWVDKDTWLRTDSPPCGVTELDVLPWSGIECSEGKHVTGIHFDHNNLKGSIPSSIGQLRKLNKLVLSRNEVFGSLPTELFDLKHLTELQVQQNTLSGEIPETIAKLSELEWLDVSSNDLGGNLATMSKLEKLTALSLWNNNFIGPLPPEFSALEEVKTFRLDSDITCCTPQGELCDACCVCEKRSKERRILGTLFNATNGPSWYNSIDRWNVDSTYHCSWHGVSCNENDEIVGINLIKNNLQGTIPASIGELDQLGQLSIGENALLSGSIPSELGLATNLQKLHLESNALTGTVPSELGDLAHLTSLKLSGNFLTGSYPSSMSNLTNLTTLFLETRVKCCDSDCVEDDFCCLCKKQTDEHIILQQIYDEMEGRNWTGKEGWENGTRHHCTWQGISCEEDGLVQEMNLSENNLKGTMLPKLYSLSKLKGLLLQKNHISGNIPPELGKLTLLTRLELEGNNLKGTVPTELMALSNLVSFSLSGVGMQGPIPLQMFSMTKLTSLALTDTRLMQNIPTHISGLHNLVSLRLDRNEIKGKVPKELGTLHRLTTLSLSNNQLRKLPSSLGELKSLTELDLEFNRFAKDERSEARRSVPAFLGEFEHLRKLTLSGNFFEGELPMRFVTLTTLEQFRLDGNVVCCSLYQSGNACNICKQILQERDILMKIYNENGGQMWKNTWKTDPENPTHFSTHHCLLEGVNCGSGSFVQEIVLENNGLIGSFPTEVGDLTHLSVLRLGGNHLSSSIPKEIEKLSKLQVMDMRANQLTGRIPYGMRELLQLEKLFLRGNLLSGSIPVFLSGSLSNIYVDENVECCDVASTKCSLCNIQKEQARERDVLWDLYETTNGHAWKNSSNWVRYDVDPCDKAGGWHGVVCDNDGYVTELHLPGNNLVGQLPETLGALQNLRELNVSSNPLAVSESANPLELIRLRNIFTSTNGKTWTKKGNFNNLDVNHCYWDGVTCNNEGRVVKLDLSSRGLSGAIPADDIGNLTELEELRLHSNQLSGEVPSQLASLSKLKHLSLSHNELKGSVPSSLANLTHLEEFLLHKNFLEGELPTFPHFLQKYISDCGEPSTIPLDCPHCTICCNSGNFCQVVVFDDSDLWEYTGVILGGILVGILLLNLIGMGLMGMIGRSVRKPIPNASFLIKESVYTFLLSKRPAWWIASLFAVFLQSATFALFLNAASDVSSDDSDWVYTWICPRDSESCIEDDPRTWVGWSILFVVLLASLAPDVIDAVRLFMLAIGRVDMHCLVLGLCITWTTSVAVWTSLVYNYAIGTTNTELIINAVILIVVNDLDEMIFTIMEHLFPSRVEDILNELRTRLQEKHCISFGADYDEVPRDGVRAEAAKEGITLPSTDHAEAQHGVMVAGVVDYQDPEDRELGERSKLIGDFPNGNAKVLQHGDTTVEDKLQISEFGNGSTSQHDLENETKLEEQRQKIETLSKEYEDLRGLIMRNNDALQKQGDQIQQQKERMQQQDDEIQLLREKLKDMLELVDDPESKS